MAGQHLLEFAGFPEHHPEAIGGGQGELIVQLEIELPVLVVPVAFQYRRHGGKP